MATTDVFSGNGNYYLEVYAALVSQSTAGNYSRIYYRVRVYKTYGSGLWASINNGSSGWADSNVGGTKDLWNDGNLAYDFRSASNSGYWTFSEGYFNVAHRSDGTGEYWVNAGMNLYALGSASVGTGTRSLPRLADVPPAPKSLGLSNITQDSMMYRFQNNGDGGSAILEWQVGWSLTSNAPTAYFKSTGTSTVTGLAPGTNYYFWARGRNAVGWGPWSVRSGARTIAGVRILVAGIWKEAVPYIKVAGVWKHAQTFYKSGTTWKKTG